MTIVLQLSEVLHSIGLTEKMSDKKRKERLLEREKQKRRVKKQLAAYLAPMSKFEEQVKLIEKETEESN